MKQTICLNPYCQVLYEENALATLLFAQVSVGSMGLKKTPSKAEARSKGWAEIILDKRKWIS